MTFQQEIKPQYVDALKLALIQQGLSLLICALIWVALEALSGSVGPQCR